MKRHLSVGEGYARKPLNFKPLPDPTCSMKNTSLKQKIGWLVTPISWAKVTGLTSLVALICLCLSVGSVSAQKYKKSTTTNTIGQKLNRDFVIGYDPFDHDKKYILDDFRDKAVIIDIWATWCSACISRFPTMDSLSRVHGDRLEILLVAVLGRDTPESIRAFVEDYQRMHPDFSLTFIIEEDQYITRFDFRSLPHYIWIDPNRRIRAHTDPKAFEDEHINRLISGSRVHVPIKII